MMTKDEVDVEVKALCERAGCIAPASLSRLVASLIRLMGQSEVIDTVCYEALLHNELNECERLFGNLIALYKAMRQ
jgi:hypothetical protein